MTFSCEACGDAAGAPPTSCRGWNRNTHRHYDEENMAATKKISIRFLHLLLFERGSGEKRGNRREKKQMLL